ncbi:MAG: DNA gyrase inhibitor YacG [Oceanospirillaceae bacterium]|uniref:DNA gyrase inhibitor YacG n=1 Tax=unclassified Thalassolituus TaxID=2624967 RepID=UPI000C0AF493|nr:DNA gyrase inhibitor YacG [Thalassolituus sp.]MAS24994.1 DNA gyrase inhibitor YacG [Oceanospirillaceae bacterium]MAX98156.1 DNA gyrase inhibitor YacG [Oceanospirillaceae bacterium]MBL34285.1 DNA gyrase inhibitor YacG [Oceanospirillaceae bacterium]MBS52763.1 DNA gyrase inhibitor YacG [Oceanospirillaceae bacterium]|tara:strand:- start:4 stop:201 length:198 start_codon:yes stop_codon:yes gene_type:complete
MKVQCPTCQKDVEWKPENKYRPFCSERCKLIDLGEWASGGHAIPGKSVQEEMMSEEWEDKKPWDS